MESMEDKPHLCAVCGDAFITTFALYLHRETVHEEEKLLNMFPDEKPSLCTVCGEAFMTHDSLNVHNVSEHQNDSVNLFPEEKPHLYTVCGEAFTSRDALRVHKETEHPDNDHFVSEFKAEGEHFRSEQNKPFSAAVRTDKAPVLTEKKKSPMKLDAPGFQINNSEAEENPFLCNFCDERFSDSQEIISHMKEEHESQAEHNETKHPDNDLAVCSEFATEGKTDDSLKKHRSDEVVFVTEENETPSTSVKRGDSSLLSKSHVISVTEIENSPVTFESNSVTTQESHCFKAMEMDKTPSMYLPDSYYTETPNKTSETDTKPHLCEICHQTFSDKTSLVSHEEQTWIPRTSTSNH